MKNSPAHSVSKSKRIRANAVWLMNAASLAIAIGSIDQVVKSNGGKGVTSLITEVTATDYTYAGGSIISSSSSTAVNWWSGTAGSGYSTKAAGTAFDSTFPSITTADNLYFGASAPMAGTSSWSSSINFGSSNQTAMTVNFVSGATSYTIFAPHTKKLTVGGSATAAAQTSPLITNASSSAITFAVILTPSVGGSSTSAAIFKQSNATGSLSFVGAPSPSSYIMNPYAYDWALSTGSTAIQAKAYASSSTAQNAIAVGTNSGGRYLNLDGSGTINVNAGISDAWRGNGGASTSQFSVSGYGNVVISNTGTTNLNGWNTYTGTTTIGSSTTSGGTVVIGNAYAFGGNRLADRTDPYNLVNTSANGTAYSVGTNAYTLNSYMVGGTSAYSASGTGAATAGTGTVASGFSNTTQAFGVVTVNNGFAVDLNGTTMLGANAMTINGTGASGVGGVLKNNSATGATYVGAVSLGSDSTITAGTGNITLSGGLAVSSYTATINGAANTTLSGAVTGSGAINKSGAGTLTLSNGGNTYTGSLNIDQGTVSFASGNASAFSASTSALSFGASNTPTLTLAGKSLTRGAISSSNTNAVIENNNAAAATLTSSAPSDSTVAGVIRNGAAGTLAFTKAGSGVLTLSNTNTYSGATTVAGGTLNVTGSIANSTLTLNSGATLAGTGTVGAASVSGIIAPGSAGIGNLTLGTTTLSGGGTLNVQIFDLNGAAGSTGWDLLTTGALTIGATSGNTFNISVKSIGGQSSDTAGSATNFNKSSNYSLKILSASSLTGYADNVFTLNTLSFSNLSSGTWSVSNTGNDIYLNYTAVNAQFWNGASGWDSSLTAGGSGTWDTGSGNYDSSVTVNFGGTGAAVTVGTPTSSKAIKFQSDGYTLSSGTITMNGADTTDNAIDVGTNMTATIGSKISSSSVQVNKTGLGTLVLSGNNSSSGISAGLLISNGRLQISDAGALGASSSGVTVASGASLDLNGQNVTNTNALTLSGTGAASAGGALINTSNNAATYAGLVTLGANATISASSGDINLTNVGTITGSGFGLTVSGASNTTIDSVIGTGSGGLTKSGNGSLRLNAANTFTGNVAVNAGRLVLGNSQALGTTSTPSVTVASGATLDLSGQNASVGNALSLSGTGAASAGGALINTSTNAATYAGLVTLGAATTINASSGNINLSNVGTISGSGFGLTIDGSSDTTISSILGTGTGTVTKNGTGTLTFNGANTNTGNMTVSAGRLKLGNAQLFGTSTPSLTVSSGATVDFNGQTVANTNAVSLTGTGAASAGGALINTSTNAATYAGLVTLAGDTTIKATSGDITLSNAGTMSSSTVKILTVDGSANTTINENTTTLRFIKNGTGTLTLNGGNTNSYSTTANVYGAVINNGTIKVGHTQAFGSAGSNGFGISNSTMAGNAILVNNGGTLDMNGIVYNKNMLAVLSGTGYSSQGAMTNTSTTAASFQAQFMLNGDTTINSSNGGLSLTASAMNIRTMNVRGYTLTLGGSGTSGSDIVASALTGSGNLVKTGTGTWTLTPNAAAAAYYLDTSDGLTYSAGTLGSTSAMNYLTGTISVNAGRLRLGVNGALGLSSGVTVAQGGTLDLNGRSLINATDLTITGTGAAGAGGALVNESATTSTYTGLVALGGDATINASAGNITLSNVGTIAGSGRTLTVDGAFSTTITSNIGTGSGGITKNGTGTLNLNGANTFTGNIAVNAGRLQVGNVGAIGSSSSPSVVVASGATIDLNGTTVSNSNNLTISGTGAAGAGGALINSASSTTSVYSGNITLADNATINASAGIISLSGVISGAYNLEIAGGSALRWTRFTGASANTFSSLTLSGYDLGFTNVNQLGSGTITSASANARIIYGATGTAASTGASFSINNELNTGSSSSYTLAVAPNDASNTITLDGKVTGSGRLKVSGGGTLVLANSNNDFSGGIEIGTGTIAVASASALGSGNINFGTSTSSGLSVTENMTVSNTFTMFTSSSGSSYTANIDVSSGKVAELTGTLSPSGASAGGKLIKTGNGILTLSGANTYAGTTTVTGGTLNLKGSGSIASSGVTVSTGATLKATNDSMPVSQNTGSITLNSGALVDLEAGSIKANNLTVAALAGSDITKISYTIGNSLALLGNLTLTGNLAVDLTSAITGAGVYDVLTWVGSKSGTGSISFIDHSNADWTMTGELSSGKYTITVASSFIDGGNYSTGSIVIPVGKGLGEVSGTSTVTAANTTTITTISGGTVTLNGSGNGIGTLSGGTLNVKAASTIDTLSAGTLSVDSGVNAEVKSGNSNAVITGAGNLIKSGNGKLTLSNTSSDYTGATTVAAGELEVTNVSALGSTSGVTLGTSSSSTAATFNYSGSAATISTDITALSTSTSGNVVQNSGSGLLTLGGTLTKDGTVLTLAGGSSGIKVTGNIAGTSANSDLVISSGTVTVSSSNSYNGPTFIENGATLIADNASATGSGVVNVAAGATLQAGTASNILTLTTGGFKLSNGSIIRLYVDHVDVTGLTAFNRDGYTHYDLSNTAGTAYSTLYTEGTFDVTDVTAGGITIEVYSADTNTPGLLTRPFYDFKFLEFTSSNLTGLGNGLNLADLFTIDTNNLKYATGSSSVHASYNYQNLDELIKMYSVQNGNNTVLMMSIPEPSTYGLGLGALALAAVAIRRRKQKKATA